MVKGIEQEYRGARTLQLSLTETEAFLLDAVLANVQRSNVGPQARLSDIGDAITEFLDSADEDLEDTVQAKFPDNIVGTFEMEFDFDKKGLHFPEIRKEVPQVSIRETDVNFRRVEVSPDRRIFYVNTGDLTKEEIVKTMYSLDMALRDKLPKPENTYTFRCPEEKTEQKEDGFTEVPGYGYIPD